MKQKFSIITAFTYLLPSAYAIVSGYWLASFALCILAYATAYYHWYDDYISAGFDHVGILFTFISFMWIWKGDSEAAWYLFTFFLLLIFLSIVNEYIVLGLGFAMMFTTYTDQVGSQYWGFMLLGYVLAFVLQRYAEQFKYKKPLKYDVFHSLWHVATTILFTAQLWSLQV